MALTLIFGDLLFATDIDQRGQSHPSWESRGVSLRNNCKKKKKKKETTVETL